MIKIAATLMISLIGIVLMIKNSSLVAAKEDAALLQDKDR